MGFSLNVLFCQLVVAQILLVILSKHLGSPETTNINDNEERTPNNQATFTIIDDEAALREEPPPQNGTRKFVGRALLPHQRNQRSSSFRLEDNGSKLHYLRTVPQNDLPNSRGDLDKVLLDLPAGEGAEFVESSVLFCYYQSVQVGYELGPSVTKCTLPGHDACMLLENTRSGVREMSCISASDCELTRLELARTKADGSVKLTCCRSNLCNSPNAKPKQQNEKPTRQQQPVSPTRQRTSSLRDRHPLQPVVEEPHLSSGGFLHDPAFWGRASSMIDVSSPMVQTPLAPSSRSARNGARSPSSASAVLTSSNLRHASSLLERSRPQKNRPTTPAAFWNNIPSGSVPQGPTEGHSELESISSLISRVLNSRIGTKLPSPQSAPQVQPKQNRPSTPSFSLPTVAEMSTPTKQALQQQIMQPQPTEQDLYQQMMLLLGEVNAAKGGATNQRTQQPQQVQQQQQRIPDIAEPHAPASFGANLLAANVCDFPPLMPNAWVSVASLEVGSEIYYQCATGYQLDGPRIATCIEQPSGTTVSPAESRLTDRILHAHPRWTQVPTCVRVSDTMGQLGDKIASSLVGESDVAVVARSSSNNNNVASSVVSEMAQTLPPPPNELVLPYSGPDEGETQQNGNVVDLSSDARRGASSDRITQCYDNRAGSVFVASCRGDSVICTRIVTMGASAMSLLSSSETTGLSSFNAESSSSSHSLSDSLASSGRSSNGQQQQQQVSQYCALLDDCLRFERWVRLANRDDIDVLCCSTDLCNA